MAKSSEEIINSVSDEKNYASTQKSSKYSFCPICNKSVVVEKIHRSILKLFIEFIMLLTLIVQAILIWAVVKYVWGDVLPKILYNSELPIGDSLGIAIAWPFLITSLIALILISLNFVHKKNYYRCSKCGAININGIWKRG